MQISQQVNVVVVVALLNNLLPVFISIVPFKMVLGASVDYCYSDIGCFPLSAEFYHPRHRPFNVRPWHRRHIRTQFELFNRDHPEGFMMLPWDRENLVNSKFNPKLETKIIVPGWLDNINRALWVRQLKDALLWLWVPVNIIVVRWVNFTPYTIATANTRVVGAEIANLMKFIDREYLYDPAYYHIIGHSLGAHIAGYCGDRIHGLGRITALDPARPFFQHMPKSVRLDRSDAKFVDAIHSDFTPENAIFLLMSYGMTTPVGHLDFYPNGPPLFQPGCMRDTLLSVQTGIIKGLEHNSLSIAFLESTRYLTACDHQRSHEWFIESITNRECAFVGVRCNEFEGMINGRCTCDDSPSACAIMGIHADQMYLHNVHDELWPVRAGSIDYKYKRPPRARPTVPQPPLPPLPPIPVQPQDYPPQAPGVDMDDMGDSVDQNYNLLMQSALLNQQQQQQQQQAQSAEDSAEPPPMPPTKDEIYGQLKYLAMQMHNQGEPSIAPVVYRDDQMESASESTNSIQMDQTVTAADQGSEPAPGEPNGDEDQMAQASDIEDTFDQHMNALDDIAFAGYLRSQLLINQLGSLEGNHKGSPDAGSNRNASVAEAGDNGEEDGMRTDDEMDPEASPEAAADRRVLDRRSSQKHSYQTNGHPDQYDGHPKLVSGINRDIESWYEDNGRWHLKTNNQPKYCSNQYQLLIFLGPLKSSRGRDKLRADLLVSIVGSRGQLLNQRFVPRGSTLTSFTMQPFFILLEGSYSLGQIKSVALSWEARNDPDPVQATVTFESSKVQQLGQNVAAYKAKQFPWLPEETKYDKSSDFSWLAPPPNLYQYSSHQPTFKGPIAAIKSSITGHYSQKYQKLDQGRRERRDLRRAGSEPKSSGTSPNNHQVKTSSSNQGECSIRKRTGCQLTGERNAAESMRRADAAEEDQTNSDEEDYNSQPSSALSDISDSPQAEQQQPVAGSEEEELEELQQQLDELLQLKQANQLQRQEILTNRLAMQQAQQHLSSSSYHAKSQMPNQTYLVNMNQHEPPPQADPQQEQAGASESDPYFVSLIDPIDETASYRPPKGSRIPPEDLVSHEGEITLDLHNVNLNKKSDEDSIVVNQVIVSPLQANYGRYGRNAKTFCPPLTKRKLKRDKTLRLTLSMMSKCSHHHQYEQQMQHLRLHQELLHQQQQSRLMLPLQAY